MASRSYTYPSKTGTYSSVKSMQDPPTGASPAYMAQVLGIKSVKSSTPKPSPQPKKRKAKARSPTPDYDEDDPLAGLATQDTLAGIGPSKPKRPCKKMGEEAEEKRLKRFRQKPPGTYLERLQRVRTQRMFLIDREKGMSEDGTCEEERFDIAGSTGNIYQVTVG